jgi:hypothetical protein
MFTTDLLLNAAFALVFSVLKNEQQVVQFKRVLVKLRNVLNTVLEQEC